MISAAGVHRVYMLSTELRNTTAKRKRLRASAPGQKRGVVRRMVIAHGLPLVQVSLSCAFIFDRIGLSALK
jgi:hypothetical protein